MKTIFIPTIKINMSTKDFLQIKEDSPIYKFWSRYPVYMNIAPIQYKRLKKQIENNYINCCIIKCIDNNVIIRIRNLKRSPNATKRLRNDIYKYINMGIII